MILPINFNIIAYDDCMCNLQMRNFITTGTLLNSVFNNVISIRAS